MLDKIVSLHFYSVLAPAIADIITIRVAVSFSSNVWSCSLSDDEVR